MKKIATVLILTLMFNQIGNLMYVKDHAYQFDPNASVSNDESWELGRRTAGAIYQLEQIGYTAYAFTTAAKNLLLQKQTAAAEAALKSAKVEAGNATIVEGAANGKLVSSADAVVFNQSSIDKAFTKHSVDFGNYANGSKASITEFTNDVKSLVNTGIQKKGIFRNTEGIHIYDLTTHQWAFINADGTFKTAFKLGDAQFKYLIETGVVK